MENSKKVEPDEFIAKMEGFLKDRCAVCGAEIEDSPTVVHIDRGVEFVLATSEGKITLHSECLGDLIAFIIDLKKKSKEGR